MSASDERNFKAILFDLYDTLVWLDVERSDVGCIVDPDHERMLTRDEVTASVHYVHFAFSPEQIAQFATGPVALVVDHPNYHHEAELGEATRGELLGDLRGS